jgi:hypothetical protein
MTNSAPPLDKKLYRSAWLAGCLQLDMPVDPSTVKTRTALFELDDCPEDRLARTVLWEENRPAIEVEMNHHLDSSDPAFLDHILTRVALRARFFCAEVDDPKAWVTRCANLEARRFALELSA